MPRVLTALTSHKTHSELVKHGFCAQDEELRLEDLTEYSLYFEYSAQLPPEFSLVTSEAKKVGEVREQDLLWIFSLTVKQ